MPKLNEDLLAALYMLGFNIDDEVPEIQGEMSIRVLCPCSSEELKFVLTLPSQQEIVFTVEVDDIVRHPLGAPS